MRRFPVVYSVRALADIDRFLKFADLEESNREVVNLLCEAIAVLAHHPLIGRKVKGSLRELIISHGRTGYVALYRISRQRVDILRIRHQRELQFRD